MYKSIYFDQETVFKMPKPTKVFVAGSSHYACWLPNIELVDNYEQADAIVFTGGEDINPARYSQPKHKTTYFNKERDEREFELGLKAVKDGKPLLGICRGAQLVCVLSGGRLVQHQQNPHFIHPISTMGGGRIDITSTHHQAMYPFNLNSDRYLLLGYTKNISMFHKDGNDKELPVPAEAEICYFYKTRALGIQGHP